MTQNKELSIADMNGTIGEFMGWERYEDAAGIWFKKEGLIKCLHPKLQELCFHSDWNWLMPVWEMFRDLRFEQLDQELRHSELRSIIAQSICFWGIENAYKRMFDAITWYNTTLEK